VSFLAFVKSLAAADSLQHLSLQNCGENPLPLSHFGAFPLSLLSPFYIYTAEIGSN
jgi:hypothetical protein